MLFPWLAILVSNVTTVTTVQWWHQAAVERRWLALRVLYRYIARRCGCDGTQAIRTIKKKFKINTHLISFCTISWSLLDRFLKPGRLSPPARYIRAPLAAAKHLTWCHRGCPPYFCPISVSYTVFEIRTSSCCKKKKNLISTSYKYKSSLNFIYTPFDFLKIQSAKF